METPSDLDLESLVRVAAQEIVKAAAAGAADLPQQVAAWWRHRGTDKQTEIAGYLGQTMTILQTTLPDQRTQNLARAEAEWIGLLRGLLAQQHHVWQEVALFVQQQRAQPSETVAQPYIYSGGDTMAVSAPVYGSVKQTKKYTRWNLGLGPLLAIIAIAVLGLGSATAFTVNILSDGEQFGTGQCIRQEIPTQTPTSADDFDQYAATDCNDVDAFAIITAHVDDSRGCETDTEAARLGEEQSIYCLDLCIDCDEYEVDACVQYVEVVNSIVVDYYQPRVIDCDDAGLMTYRIVSEVDDVNECPEPPLPEQQFGGAIHANDTVYCLGDPCTDCERFHIGGCAEADGDEAVAISCDEAGPGDFEITDEVSDATQCPDPNEPNIVSGGKTYCLRTIE